MGKLCLVGIQAAARGFLARRKAKKLRERRDAATCIQAHWRGKQGRKRALEYRKNRYASVIAAKWRARADKGAYQRLVAARDLAQQQFRVKKSMAQMRQLNNVRKEKELLQSKAVKLDAAQADLEKSKTKVQ